MTFTPDHEATDGVPGLEPQVEPQLEPQLEPGVSPLEPVSPATSPLLAVANATVRVYKAAFGRGPTHARARFAGSDTLVVLLQDTLTISERRLAALGAHERLRDQRLLLHQTLEPEIRALVERILRRPTLGLISGIDTRRDLAVEVITLAPVAVTGFDGAG